MNQVPRSHRIWTTLAMIAANVTFFGSQSQAAVDASTVVRYYTDSQRTVVLSPSIDVGATFNEDRMKISAHVAQDILTSASSEVRTYASKGEISDFRNEYQVNFESQIPDGTLSVGVITSDESDYSSKMIVAGGTREFFTKNTVVAFGLASTDNKITATGNTSFAESMQAQLYSISLSQILSKNSLFQLIYDFRVENGYIASPYRRAKLIAGGTISALNENHPRTRNRHAVGFKYNYYVNPLKMAFATSYRIYQDSWGVLSHTFEERVTLELSRKFETSFSARFYTQDKATFYQDYYTDNPGVFFSGNNTLATYISYGIGVRPAYNLTENTNLSLKLEYFAQNFTDATDAGQLSTRDDDKRLEISAFVIGFGLSAKF